MTVSMPCPSCGHPNEAGANFCSSCGTRLDIEERTITFHPDDLDGAAQPAPADLDGPVVLVSSGPYAGSRYTLKAGVTTVGRHPDSDIFLDDVTVSRRHVEIEQGPDGDWSIRDVGSLNGTYVNRSRVEEAQLANGDDLQIGKFKLVFLQGDG